MKTSGWTLFDTAIGRCGIAWTGRGIAGVRLPEGSEREMRARLRRRFPDAPEAPPPPEVRRVIGGVIALLRGEPSELEAIRLDMDGVPSFDRRVYEAARTIPPGTTRSYGEVAARMGAPGSARDVGQALGR
ncbi:MAG: methylated-DNA--[protein]-cysteine S-methyltransferase, partial [Candidatus Rokuibacteriota bacterium]